jgi:TonB family protein
MRAKREEGMVVALVTITDQGLPVDIRAIRSFSLAAAESTVSAIRGWRFTPAKKPSGVPYAVRTIVEVSYRLQR